MADSMTIKKIRTAAGDHDIDARFWNGHEFSAVESMIHGVVDTYVIPSSKSSVSGYNKIVGVTDSTITTIKKSELNALVSTQPADANKTYKVGDIVLIEEVSTESKFIFDRWVSNVGTGTDPIISLTILETQAATHHHTITLSNSASKALTGASSTQTTNAIPTVGDAVTVLTGTSGTVVTSVSFDDNGSHNLSVTTAVSTDAGSAGHSHTVNSHDHKVSFTPTTLVSQNVNAYTTLTSSNYTPHTHTTTTVAGVHTDEDDITYVYGGGTASFVKSLKTTSTATTGQSLTTDANTAGLVTDSHTLTSGSAVNNIKTAESGSHAHSVTTTTTESVVKSVTLAPTVVTSVKYNNATLAGTVVTSISTDNTKVITNVTPTSGSANFLNSFSCSVDASGILSFSTGSGSALTSVGVTLASARVISSVTPSTTTQTNGSITALSTSQSESSGTVDASGSAESAGAHQHGFSHTHAISSHTHGVASHTHSYDKTSVSASDNAYISLSTKSYTPHTHANTTVIGTSTNGSPLKFVDGGTTTTVVATLKDTSEQFTSTSSEPGTSTAYHKLSGDIDFPGLKVEEKTISTTTVTPAVAGTEKPIKSITYTSSNFVTTVTSGTISTSENIAGKE